MAKSTLIIKRELAEYARKAAEDKLTIASSGNISARHKDHMYIKRQGACFQEARPSDFIRLGLNGSLSALSRGAPSFEYRFHIACYRKRPAIKAVLHTHPIIITTLYSSGFEFRPITLEFALYIGKSITAIDFIPPGSKELAATVGDAVEGHDAIVLKKHGLVTVGASLQEAYLKALIIEREARAHFICRLFRRSPPFLKKEELSSIV